MLIAQHFGDKRTFLNSCEHRHYGNNKHITYRDYVYDRTKNMSYFLYVLHSEKVHL